MTSVEYTVYKTRFPELGYGRIPRGGWRFVYLSTMATVGPIYKSKAELLADLPRYAKDFGCEWAS